MSVRLWEPLKTTVHHKDQNVKFLKINFGSRCPERKINKICSEVGSSSHVLERVGYINNSSNLDKQYHTYTIESENVTFFTLITTSLSFSVFSIDTCCLFLLYGGDI